jgi:GNAT superfamily N-acetyltransferase
MMTRRRTRPAVSFAIADVRDVEGVMAIRNAAAEALTRRHGPGPWSLGVSEVDVRWWLRTSRIVVARTGDEVAGALRLATRKPWAIDVAFFTPVRRPLYLLDMAVAPEAQGRGLGRALLTEAIRLARARPGDAIRLDAYDAPAGAGGFYARCGWAERGRVTYREVALIYYEFVLGPAACRT